VVHLQPSVRPSPHDRTGKQLGYLMLTLLIMHVPTIVKYVQLYSSLLNAHARNEEVFRLEEDATRLNFDIVGRVVMDHDFESLTGENGFVTLLRAQISWFLSPTTTNLADVFNPVRKFMFKYYKRQMDKYIGRVLDERISARALSNPASKQEKTGLDLIIESYVEESRPAKNAFIMSQDFRRHTINNMILLVFAGHDTTTSTVCYCYYELSKRPEKLQRLRNELDTVFGTNPTITAAAQLT
jgi:cytochrome P450